LNSLGVVRGRFFLLLGCILVLGACAETQPHDTSSSEPAPSLKAAAFEDLSGWRHDRHGGALRAFLRSCSRLMPLPDTRGLGGLDGDTTVKDWRAPCRAAERVNPDDDAAARRFFERWFAPHRIVAGGNSTGLFTGYYEAELRGSWRKTARFTVPIYTRPNDLVSADLGEFSPHRRGEKISGRVRGDRLVPYHDRDEIDRGALSGKNLELLWVDSAIDAFFLHVQGSGRIMMEDGSVVRVGFAARNGRPYVAIGRVLIESGALDRDKVSMQSIRAWLAAHPREAVSVMARNPSYIFFRRLRETNPVGAQGVLLTPGRSLAVDRRYIPLGAPLWLETRDPLEPTVPLRRLVIAQDTGSAIAGPVRGDLFWGFGRDAAERAGRMKAPGAYFLLLPKPRCC
jgi:membrane-bound lytic murein transglycosylase A